MSYALNMNKILVIDDDNEICEITTAFFAPKGYKIDVTTSVETVLADLISGKVKPDVILVDLTMPKVSGLELIQTFQQNNIRIPVIVITASRDIDTAVMAIEAGAFDYLIKPLNFPQLRISVERALHFNSLDKENQTLKSAIQLKDNPDLTEMKGKSASLLKIIEFVKRVAPSKANVYISGESGTGKEVLARAIHKLSGRPAQTFVAINCSAIPENLLETELFGHAKGAFTGAVERKSGLFQEANGGTLFLDEIGDLSLPLQAKLLRVIQDKKVKRVGETQEQELDVRIISATHRDLWSETKSGNFREDLFFRLNVIPLYLPPLRERKEDIMPLAEFFLQKFCSINEVQKKSFSSASIDWLMKNPWKGNIRELENTVERAVVFSRSDRIEVTDLAPSETRPPAPEASNDLHSLFMTSKGAPQPLDSIVKKYILHVLELNRGAKEKTANDLQIDRKTLYRKLQEIKKAESSMDSQAS